MVERAIRILGDIPDGGGGTRGGSCGGTRCGYGHGHGGGSTTPEDMYPDVVKVISV